MLRILRRTGLATLALTGAAVFAAAAPAQASPVYLPLSVNHAPVALSQSTTTAENLPVAINLHATDADGDQLTYEAQSTPAHGSLSGSGSALTYTPATDYVGTDSFTFLADDGRAISNLATVSITVNLGDARPRANDQTVTTVEGTPLPVTLTGFDANSDPLTFSLVASPNHGTLSGTAPNLTYTPAPGFTGHDLFTFRTSDGILSSSIGTIDITVLAPVHVNTPPVAFSQSVTTHRHQAVAITLHGSDADSDPLTYAVGTGPSHGTLSGTAPSLTYTPTDGYAGADSFTFTVNDGHVNSSVATVSITVLRHVHDNRPGVAQDALVTTSERTPVGIVLHGSDPDGDDITFHVASNPANGTLTGTAPNLQYTPAPGFHGIDSFTFTVNDGLCDSAVGTIVILVREVHHRPIAEGQDVVTSKGHSVTFRLKGWSPDHGPLSFVVTDGPDNGTFVQNGDRITYTPDRHFTGNDRLRFTVREGSDLSREATVRIHVTHWYGTWHRDRGEYGNGSGSGYQPGHDSGRSEGGASRS